jgi:uncharacterized membrane protein YtjA (UPF0391 family)
MMTWAITLLAVATVAAAIGFTWYAGTAAYTGWFFVVGGLIVLRVLAATDRLGPPSKGPSDARPEH